MTTILLADDHPMVRAGLRRLLEEDRNVTEIGEAASGDETFERLRSSHWDLLLLDIRMPDRNGMDVLRQVRAEYPATKVLILSAFPERQYAINTLKAGASGYLPKECAPEDLLVAVRTVLQGRKYLSAQLAQLLVSDLDTDSNQPLHSRLSERELQIFHRLATGGTVSGIGAELRLSIKTVSTYRTRIFEKMNFASNADITMYALRNELTHTHGAP